MSTVSGNSKIEIFDKNVRKPMFIASAMMIGTAMLAATIAAVIFCPVTVPVGVVLGAALTFATLSSSCIGVGVWGIASHIFPLSKR
jgi:hypothetical protein